MSSIRLADRWADAVLAGDRERAWAEIKANIAHANLGAISDAQNRIDSNPEFLNACLVRSPEKERAASVRARTASYLFRLH